jgi:hypothetical protein
MVKMRRAAAKIDGSTMRRVIAIALAGASLGGCSSTSLSDHFGSKPPILQVQLESQPSGADAKTSLGPGCKTPCSVSVTTADTAFSVVYTLAQFQPATVAVNVIRNPGDLTTSATVATDPNPVFAELQPAGPPPKAQKMHPKKKKPKPAAAAPAATGADTAVPDPNAPPPAAPPSNR